MLRAARRTTGSVLGQDRGRPTVPSLLLRRSARELPIEDEVVEEHVGEVHPIAGAEGNSLPVP